MSINVTQTAWSNTDMNYANFIKNEYYDLIFGNGLNENLMSYFLSSRAVDLGKKEAMFSIFEVSMGKGIKTNVLFNSRGGSIEYWDRIRPIVEIPMREISLDKTDGGYTPDTAIRLLGTRDAI